MTAPRMTFTFEKCLGQGGFGEVYLATLTRPGGLEKKVAVKVLKEELRNTDEAVQRLRDEGRMLAILDHPCIVRVLEMTLIRGRVSLVTEYIDGIDLSRCCKVPRLLPHKVVIGAIGEVASALHCAWTTPSPETGKALKLIHRDVKPENIRIGKHGEVKLLDFGIARTTEMYRHAKTAQGDLPFTPGYAAPEAFTKGFQGSSSDVYALGITLYRLLAGERFYEGMDLSAQVSTCCLNERYAPFLRRRLSKLELHPDLMALLKDMLAYEAVDRPSAQQVESRCVALCDKLDGPTHVRWARGVDFPEPAGLDGGSLTGQTVEEDPIEVGRTSKRRGVRLTPKGDSGEALLKQVAKNKPKPSAPSVVADLTPPMVNPDPHPPSPNRTDTPSAPSGLPPLPPGLVASSVRPVTGRVSLADLHADIPSDFASAEYDDDEAPTVRIKGNQVQTLDGFVYDPDAGPQASSIDAPLPPPSSTPAPIPPRTSSRGAVTVDPDSLDMTPAPEERMPAEPTPVLPPTPPPAAEREIDPDESEEPPTLRMAQVDPNELIEPDPPSQVPTEKIREKLPPIDFSTGTPAPTAREPERVPVQSGGMGTYLLVGFALLVLLGLLVVFLLAGGLLLGFVLAGA